MNLFIFTENSDWAIDFCHIIPYTYITKPFSKGIMRESKH